MYSWLKETWETLNPTKQITLIGLVHKITLLGSDRVGLEPLLCYCWLVPAHETHLCSFLSTPFFSNVMLKAWNHPWWVYLYHRNWQTLQTISSKNSRFTSMLSLEPRGPDTQPHISMIFQPLRHFETYSFTKEWQKLRILVWLNVYVCVRIFQNFNVEEEYLLTGQYLVQSNHDSWGSCRGQNKSNGFICFLTGPRWFIL